MVHIVPAATTPPAHVRIIHIARFVVTGATATTLNLLILWLLVAKLGVWYLGASVVSFSLSLAVNFMLQRVWAFATANSGRPASQLAQFVAFNLLAMLLNTAILYTAVEWVGLSSIVGQLVSSAILALMSYRAYRWIFRPGEQNLSIDIRFLNVSNAVAPHSML